MEGTLWGWKRSSSLWVCWVPDQVWSELGRQKQVCHCILQTCLPLSPRLCHRHQKCLSFSSEKKTLIVFLTDFRKDQGSFNFLNQSKSSPNPWKFLITPGAEQQQAKGSDSSAFSEHCFFSLWSLNRCSDYHKTELSTSSAMAVNITILSFVASQQISHYTLIFLIFHRSTCVFLLSFSSSTSLIKFLLFFQDIS